MSRHLLEISVFLCGAVVMIFELVGSRIVGPYLGTSIFVWTSLIGIILGGLSLGYALGGRMADRHPAPSVLARIVFSAALSILFVYVFKDPILMALSNRNIDLRLGAVIAASILFLPASILLGMVSPYAVKLRIDNLKKSGSTIGNLYALSTLGSIAGTFVSGFYLIPHFGTNRLLLLLSFILGLVSVLLAFLPSNTSGRPEVLRRLISFFFVAYIAGSLYDFRIDIGTIADVDTPYNRVWIYESPKSPSWEAIRTFSINNENSSAMYLESEKLVYPYTRYYHLARHFNPGFQKTAMLGGAGYSFPKDFLRTYTDATIEVAEIDPGITELAREYFRLQDNPRLSIRHEDGRIFLNRAEPGYDAIFGDAFSSQYSLPYQLTTIEAVRRKYDLLNEGGVVVLNIIASIEGEKGMFLRSEYETYKAVFPQVYLFPVNRPGEGEVVQNIALVALKSEAPASFRSTDPEISEMLSHVWKTPIVRDMKVLTDDFAPVEFLVNKTL